MSTLVCFTVLSHVIGSWDPLQSQQLPQEKDAEDKGMLVSGSGMKSSHLAAMAALEEGWWEDTLRKEVG